MEYPGRLWKYKKIISFWKYPETKEKLNKLIKDLEKYLNIKILNNDWKIQIIRKDNKTMVGDLWHYQSNEKIKKNIYKEEIIPIEDYLNDNEYIENIHINKNKPKMKKKFPFEWRYAMRRESKILKFNQLFESNNDRIEKLKKSDFIKEIIDKGWKPYLVGGFVRDYLLNKDSNDVDIVVVGCDKEELIELLNKYGKPDLVGESFSVIKFDYNGEVYDIALPRTEKKIGKGYKGFEVLSDKNISLEEDLFRRDITINSIAMDLNRNIVDPYGGVKDLKNKIIRVTNPKAFTEDPLRILRCIRFSARFGFKIAEETKNKIKQIKNNISELSQERIIEEIYKIFKHAKLNNNSDIIYDYFKLVDDFNLWDEMLNNIKISNLEKDKISSFKQEIVFANLFEDNENINEKMIKNGFNSRLSGKVKFLIDFKNNINDDENVYKLMKDKNRYSVKDETIIEYSETNSIDDRLAKKFIRYCNSERISGNDLLKKGFKGKELGDELKKREIEKYKNS